jgi:hypothetical protein
MSLPKPSPVIISFLTLRKTIGFLGMLLPAMLLLVSLLFSDCRSIQYSISQYYYTIAGDVLVGVLSAVAIFLVSYKGYETIDNVASTVAGLCALGVAFFACAQNPDSLCSVRSLPDVSWRVAIHYASAACFFIVLSLMSLFLFTKSKGHKTPQKIKRNRIYRTCGIIILVAIALIAIYSAIPFLKAKFACYNPVFWLEWIALIAFGISWLVKGKFMMSDKEE